MNEVEKRAAILIELTDRRLQIQEEHEQLFRVLSWDHRQTWKANNWDAFTPTTSSETLQGMEWDIHALSCKEDRFRFALGIAVDGYRDGREHGIDVGYEHGYNDGYEEGRLTGLAQGAAL